MRYPILTNHELDIILTFKITFLKLHIILKVDFEYDYPLDVLRSDLFNVA